MAEPITVDDLRAVLPGGDGFSDTHGVGLALALDTMTAVSRDLEMVWVALTASEDNADTAAQVIQRISFQLASVAKICWRLDGARDAENKAPEAEAAQ